MGNASTMAVEKPVRMMIVGDPGAGKTGALASLVDAGFKLRIEDYDGNLDPLFKYVKNKDMLKNVDILSFEDKTSIQGQFMMPTGIPTAFANGLKALDSWKYYEDTNELVGIQQDLKRTVTDLGSSKDWGPDTIVVLDSLTKMGDAAFRRAQKMMNKNPSNTTQQVWGLAMAEQMMFLERLTSTTNKHHVIVLAHIKMISPKDVQKGDDDTTKELKQRIIDLIPTRLFPRALGQENPQVVGGEFPTLILAEPEVKQMSVKRYLYTVPRPELSLKIPANLPKRLEISDGLLHIFNALSPQSVAAVRPQGSGPLKLPEEGTNA